MSSAVANASPLISLARINRFSLFRHLFQDIAVPEAVWQEVVVRGIGRPAARAVVTAVQEGWLCRHSIRDTLASEMLRATLGPGEAEAIVLAQELQATWVLLDDDLARTHAHRIGLSVKGTVGILLAAYQAGVMADLRMALDELRAQGFWLSDRIYNAVLSEPPSQPMQA